MRYSTQSTQASLENLREIVATSNVRLKECMSVIQKVTSLGPLDVQAPSQSLAVVRGADEDTVMTDVEFSELSIISERDREGYTTEERLFALRILQR